MSSPGLGESYFRNSRTDPLLHSPISSPPRTSKSYEQPHINGEVLLEEILFARPASSLDQSKRNGSSTNTSKLNSPPRRWRLIPATCTCPVHGSSGDYEQGSAGHSSFMSEDSHYEYSSKNGSPRRSRFSSTRGRILDEELDRLKGSVHQLETDVLHKMPRKISPGKTYRTSTFREKTEIESTRKELESELKGWQSKLLDQMEGLKQKLEHETSQRSAKEHDLSYKTNQCERLQRQLDDTLQRLRTAEDRISELTTAKNKAKDQLREVLEEHEHSLNRSMENSRVAEDMRRVLEHEMEVRVRVETELQNLQKLVERAMADSMESRKALDARNRELEDARNANSRLERELYSVKNSVDHDKRRFNGELERTELDCQQLRDQLSLVTTQLERERELHQEQMKEKNQELNHLQHEIQRLQKRIAELEALLEKSNNKHRHADGEAEQQRDKIVELESVKSRLENEVNQLHGRMRNVDKDRERMVAAIHDLQSQVDTLQSKGGEGERDRGAADQEIARLVAIIRDLEAQIEELNKRLAEEREHASKLHSEVDETNCALDEVRLGLEKEMELRKEAESENQILQKMFEEEVNQWRAKEAEWERERAELREQDWEAYEQDKFDRLQADIERLEEQSNKELEDRDTIIDSLREQLSRAESGTNDKKFEERMRMQVEGFQEQVKDLCIQLEESQQKLERESKARADVEAGKKRLEKALLELNAKLQATPPRTRDDAQISSLKSKLAEVEDELERSRASAREGLADFEFDAELVDVDDSDIDETGEHVRVKLSDIQRVLRKLNQIVSEHHRTRYSRETVTHETEETPDEEENSQEEVVEDEDEEEEVLQNGHLEEEEEEEQKEEEKELEPFDIPTTPNGTKRVHFGTPSPPATPPNQETSPPHTPPAARATPTSPTPLSSAPSTPHPLLPSNDAEHDRLANEWKRRVASSANQYTHSRVPLSSSKRLYPDTPARITTPTVTPTKLYERDVPKPKITSLRKSVSDPKIPETPQTPTHAGQAPGFYYVPVKSDEIDEKVSTVVGETESSTLSDIPKNFSRLDKGVYQFGTKKIHMQIRDGDLVVRVGGGFMKFQEYLAKHARVENVKFQRTGMSFTKKKENVSTPLKKKTPQKNSQDITTPSKWELSLEEEES